MILLAFAVYTLELEPLTAVEISERAFKNRTECAEYVETLANLKDVVNKNNGSFMFRTNDEKVIAGGCLTGEEYMQILNLP